MSSNADSLSYSGNIWIIVRKRTGIGSIQQTWSPERVLKLLNAISIIRDFIPERDMKCSTRFGLIWAEYMLKSVWKFCLLPRWAALRGIFPGITYMDMMHKTLFPCCHTRENEGALAALQGDACMAEDYRTERYTKEKRGQCVRLFHKVFTAEPFFFDWLEQDNIERYFRDMEHTPNFLSFVLCKKYRIVGACFGQVIDYFMYPEYKINEFFVDPEFQSRGLGSALLNDVENMVLEWDVCWINLFTQANMPSFNFYKRRGYSQSPETLQMVKPLPRAQG
jgi:aminoglycoside 6'-N-acetyltransferase I